MRRRVVSVVLGCAFFLTVVAVATARPDAPRVKTMRERIEGRAGIAGFESRILYPSDLCEGDLIEFRFRIDNISQDGPGPYVASIDNPVPGGASLEPGSLGGGAVFDPANQRIFWEGPLAVGESHTIEFALRVGFGLPPGILLLNETIGGVAGIPIRADILIRACPREGELAGPSFEVPAPPSFFPWLASTALPGFEAKVGITPPGKWGTTGEVEPRCIAETLCVSGALPGRPELFVKMVGPRPNGFLWTQVSRFTPSRVTLWLRQTSTGLMRFYDLEAAGTGEDPYGLQDRQAFYP